jgi:methionyl-tRNA formyltransferase
MKLLKDIRIIYMGTPEFAVSPLQYLVEKGLQIVAIVTAPDKPAGRGLQLQHSAVKKYALTQNIPILQPEKLKNEDFITALKAFEADIQIVVAFRMLPEIVWNMPPMGTVNLHASLLPNYRGAAPINWAVIHGEQETGLTTFLLQHQIDTGNILLQEKIRIGEQDTVGMLYNTMMQRGGALLYTTLARLIDCTIEPTPQVIKDTDKHAPKIFTETCVIDFLKTVQEVHNLVRGLSPYPGAFTKLIDNKILKIFLTQYELIDDDIAVQTIITDKKNTLKIKCANGYIHILELQMEGKKRMTIKDFLQGWRL